MFLIARMPSGVFTVVHCLFQNFVARRQATAHDLEHASLVQLLEHFIRSQDRFRMFFGCLLKLVERSFSNGHCVGGTSSGIG